MKKENILVVAIVCMAVAGIMMYKNSRSAKQLTPVVENTNSQTSDATGINWQGYTQGMKLAKKTGKHIFLYFHADWCTYCKKLKMTTFRDKEVLAYLNDNFISIAVDTDYDKSLTDQWNVKGLPTLWFLKPDNSKISSIPGYVDKEYFIGLLKYIHTQNYDKMTLSEFVKTI